MKGWLIFFACSLFKNDSKMKSRELLWVARYAEKNENYSILFNTNWKYWTLESNVSILMQQGLEFLSPCRPLDWITPNEGVQCNPSSKYYWLPKYLREITWLKYSTRHPKASLQWELVYVSLIWIAIQAIRRVHHRLRQQTFLKCHSHNLFGNLLLGILLALIPGPESMVSRKRRMSSTMTTTIANSLEASSKIRINRGNRSNLELKTDLLPYKLFLWQTTVVVSNCMRVYNQAANKTFVSTKLTVLDSPKPSPQNYGRTYCFADVHEIQEVHKTTKRSRSFKDPAHLISAGLWTLKQDNHQDNLPLSTLVESE